MNYIAHQLQQGTPEWHAHRAAHFNGSEAAAMLGLSQYTTRDQLLHQKATGIIPDVDSQKQRLFDKGHAIEAAARPRAEDLMGDLYPLTASREVDGMPLSSSFDGVNIDDTATWECKSRNAALAESLAAGVIPDAYKPQLEHGLMIIGATRCLFTAGTEDGEGELSLWYESDPELRARLIAGWKQFKVDMAGYVAPVVKAAAVAAPVESLPAVSVRLNGALAVVSNLPEVAAAVRAFIDRMVPKPVTDQQFADAEAECKALKKGEDALEAAENAALGELTDVDAMRRAVADLRSLMRSTRLAREKIVDAEKTNRRGEIVAAGVAGLRDHVAKLNERIGRQYMPTIPADFGGAVKGLKSLTSMEDKVSTTLANAKIAANEWADRITLNMRHLQEHAADFKALFPDMATIVLKQPEDLQSLVAARIGQHKQAEQERADQLAEQARERIRKEEAARIEREQREAAELRAKAEREEADRLAASNAAIQAEAQKTQSRIAEARAAEAMPVQLLDALSDTASFLAADSATTTAIQTARADAAMTSANVVPLQRPAAPPADDGARITLTDIKDRIHPLQITAEGLALVGFAHVATDRAAKLYRAADLPLILDALIARLAKARDTASRAA